MNFDQSQMPENNSVESIKIPENKTKEGVDFVFEQNKENIFKKYIESIENSALSIESKIELSLLLLDRKQGVQIGDYKIVNSQVEKDTVIQEFTQEISNILSLLSGLRLQYKIVKDLSDDNDMVGFSVLVSKNKEILNKFTQADKEHDDKTFGLILGYPPTAVEAYGTDRAFNIERDLPKIELEKLQSEGVLPFLLFIPSKEHWDEELEWARKNQKLIEDKAPKLYQELIK